MDRMDMAWRILELNNRLSIQFGDTDGAMEAFPC